MYIQICDCAISVWEIRQEHKTKKATEKDRSLCAWQLCHSSVIYSSE